LAHIDIKKVKIMIKVHFLVRFFLLLSRLLLFNEFINIKTYNVTHVLSFFFFLFQNEVNGFVGFELELLFCLFNVEWKVNTECS